MRQFVLYLYRHSGYGLALLRIILGALFLYLGYRKVFELGFAIEYFDTRGIPIPMVLGPVFSLLELVGGLFLVIGFLTRYIGVLFTLEYLFLTLFMLFSKGFVSARLEFMFLTAAILLATQGAGRFAVDRPGRPWEPRFDRRG